MKLSESINILKELICLNSENPPGNTRSNLEWIKNWADNNNITAETQWYEENKGNIILSVGESDKSIVLCGHLDTVPIGDPNNWNFDPLGAIENDGFIYGRGAADMKGGVAACLAALKKIKNAGNNDLEYKIVFLGTSDEEIGMEGAKTAVKSGFMDQVKLLIVTEPTALNVGIAEKGILWLSVHSYGKAAHGSTPEKGVNAIEKLVDTFPILHSEIPKTRDPILGTSTLNIGMIKGGKSANVVPEHAEVHCDYRIVPPVDPEHFANEISDKITHFSKENSAQYEIKIKQILPSVYTSEENLYIQHFLTKNVSQDIIGLNYGTDAAILVDRNPPVPFIIFGPGNPKRIHVANERVSMDEVIEVESVLTKFLFDLPPIT